MTEELQKIIDRLTCQNCAGGGTLSWSDNKTLNGRVIRYGNTIPCGKCGGDGINLTGVLCIEHDRMGVEVLRAKR